MTSHILTHFGHISQACHWYFMDLFVSIETLLNVPLIWLLHLKLLALNELLYLDIRVQIKDLNQPIN